MQQAGRDWEEKDHDGMPSRALPDCIHCGGPVFVAHLHVHTGLWAAVCCLSPSGTMYPGHPAGLVLSRPTSARGRHTSKQAAQDARWHYQQNPTWPIKEKKKKKEASRHNGNLCNIRNPASLPDTLYRPSIALVAYQTVPEYGLRHYRPHFWAGPAVVFCYS